MTRHSDGSLDLTAAESRFGARSLAMALNAIPSDGMLIGSSAGVRRIACSVFADSVEPWLGSKEAHEELR